MSTHASKTTHGLGTGTHFIEVPGQHHLRCFSLWIAGSVKGGVVHGGTDEFSYNIVRDRVHVRDFQATILHLFGINHGSSLINTGTSTSA